MQMGQFMGKLVFMHKRPTKGGDRTGIERFTEIPPRTSCLFLIILIRVQAGYLKHMIISKSVCFLNIFRPNGACVAETSFHGGEVNYYLIFES